MPMRFPGRHDKRLSVFLLMILFLLPLESVFSQVGNKDFLKVSLAGYLVVPVADEQGVSRESLQALPDTVLPGGVIQYQITAFNASKGNATTDTLKNVALLGSIPNGTVYLGKSASALYSVTFSIDGGSSYHTWPVAYKVRLPDGTETLATAEPEQCTGIKWILTSLAPQESISITYRVKVLAK